MNPTSANVAFTTNLTYSSISVQTTVNLNFLSINYNYELNEINITEPLF